MRKNNKLFRVLTVAMAAGICGNAYAETPFGLILSETLSYDTNILRDDDDKRSDLVSSTGVKLTFDKSYGRQRYRASALGVFQRYKNNNDFDNDGYEAEAGVTSGVGANGLVSFDYNKSRTLQDFGDQGLLRRYRETIDSSSADLKFRYGLYGRWGLSSNLTRYETKYDVNQQFDKTVDGLRVGVRHEPSDLLSFDVGVKKSRSELENYPIYYRDPSEFLSIGSTLGDKIDRTDINVISDWTITGLSKLNVEFGLTRERHERDEQRDFNGWTGRGTWIFTPRGKVSYSLGFSRDTNNAGGSTIGTVRGTITDPLLGTTAERRLTTALTGTANWQATSKISSSLSVNWRRLQEERREAFTLTPRRASGSYRSLSLAMRYDPTRYLSFSCNVNVYKRTETVLSIGYSGESVGCTGSFIID